MNCPLSQTSKVRTFGVVASDVLSRVRHVWLEDIVPHGLFRELFCRLLCIPITTESFLFRTN